MLHRHRYLATCLFFLNYFTVLIHYRREHKKKQFIKYITGNTNNRDTGNCNNLENTNSTVPVQKKIRYET
jgi:hypothetical protein